MRRRDQIIEILQAADRPMDDDELAREIVSNRHYVNSVCRGLADEGIVLRQRGPGGKFVNRLASEGEPTAQVRHTPGGGRSARRLERSRRNVEPLISSFDEAVRR